MTKSQPKSPANTVVGIGWYSPEQWELLCEVAVDRDSLDDTYADWQKNVENVMRGLRKEGLHLEKIPVDVADLVLWCQKQKLPAIRRHLPRRRHKSHQMTGSVKNAESLEAPGAA